MKKRSPLTWTCLHIITQSLYILSMHIYILRSIVASIIDRFSHRCKPLIPCLGFLCFDLARYLDFSIWIYLLYRLPVHELDLVSGYTILGVTFMFLCTPFNLAGFLIQIFYAFVLLIPPLVIFLTNRCKFHGPSHIQLPGNTTVFINWITHPGSTLEVWMGDTSAFLKSATVLYQ